MYLLKSCFVSLISLRYCQTVQYGGNVVCSKRIPLLFDLLEPGICLIHKAHPADVGSGQVVWACTGKNKTLPPSTSLPVMGEIAGVNTASLGGRLHFSKTKAKWAKGFHDEPQWPRARSGKGLAPSGCALPLTHHVTKTSNHTIPDRSPPGSTRTIGTWNTRILVHKDIVNIVMGCRPVSSRPAGSSPSA